MPRGFRPNKRWPNPATVAGFNSSLVVHHLKSIMQAVILACPLRTRFIVFHIAWAFHLLKKYCRCPGPTRSFVQGHITKKHLLSGSNNCNKTSWLNYIKYKYLEPKSLLFLKINPPKQGLFPTTSATKGFQVSIHIISSSFVRSFFSKLTSLRD